MSLSSSTLLFSLSLILLLSTLTSSQNSLLLTSCVGSNYTSPSPYSSTLRRLLNNLTSAANSPSLFTTATSGDPSNPLFGLAQCRPDITTLECFICIDTAATSSSDGCPLSRSAALCFDHCILRYSDEDFFGSIESSQSHFVWNQVNASNPATFRQSVGSLMSEVKTKAALAEARFAVGDGSVGDGGEQRVYGMAWCTMDLPGGTCFKCLQDAMKGLRLEKIGSRVVVVSCALRFEIYPFYDMGMNSSPSPESLAVGARPAGGLSGSSDLSVPAGGLSGFSDNANNVESTSRRRTVPVIGITLAAALALI